MLNIGCYNIAVIRNDVPEDSERKDNMTEMVTNEVPASNAYLEKMNKFWRAANYLSACQLYLLDNPLLKSHSHRI